MSSYPKPPCTPGSLSVKDISVQDLKVKKLLTPEIKFIKPATVGQLVSNSTSVAVVSPVGKIAMFSTVIAAATSVSFNITGSFIKADDIVSLSVQSFTGVVTTAFPVVSIKSVVDGTITVVVRNSGTTDLSNVVFSYVLQ